MRAPKRTKLRQEAREAIERAIGEAQGNPSLPRQLPGDVAVVILTELTRAGIGFARRKEA